MTLSTQPQPEKLMRPDGEHLAYLRRPATRPGPGLLWLGGFRSDMTGTKASAVDLWAAETGRGFLRFDYFAHGQSSGDFRQATIGRWRDDALAVLDTCTEGPHILVGSSLGGWIALLIAALRPARISGVALIAPAPDFTERLMWPALPRDIREAILRDGETIIDSPEGPYPLTRAMFESGRAHLLLEAGVAFHGPVRILQGLEDDTVPYGHALATAKAIASRDVTVTLVKNGDHRLSTPADIARLTVLLDDLCNTVQSERPARSTDERKPP